MNDDRSRRRSSSPHEPGTVVGAYKLVRQLDRGGMAEVWIAKNVGTGRAEKHVALKCIHPHLVREPQFVTMFFDEARLAAKIHDPRVAQIYEGRDG